MISPATVSLACLLSMLPGPPGIEFENSYLQVLPVDKTKCPYVRPGKDIVFRLYTDSNPTVYHELVLGDDETLADSHIDFRRPTVVYFHAFLESPDSESGTLIREGYMLRGHTNLIMVDAQRLEAGPWYLTAAENTWYIGQYTARLLDYLVSRGLRLDDTHLIGHSLGAQAAGVAGSALASGTVARITGLDPALPLFSKLPLEHRLDRGDATFVDIIHTDAGIFGIHNPMGHADFYPNGGISPQPGCELEVVWPRHMILEKCPTTSRILPANGLYIFTMQEKPHAVEKDNLNTLKDFTIAKRKLKKYFIYSKLDAHFEKWLKRMSHAVQKYENVVDKHEVRKKQIKNNEYFIKNKGTYIKTGDTSQEVTPTDTSTVDHAPQSIGAAKITAVTVHDATLLKIPAISEKVTVPHDDSSPTDLEISFQSPKPSILAPEREKTHLGDDKLENYYKDAPKTRQKRGLFRREENSDDNMLLKILEFLIRYRKNVIPVVSVMREITTLVKSANGELNHSSKERNNYIGTAAPNANPVTFNLSLGKDPPMRAFVKRLLGIGAPTDQLSIAGVPGK